MSLPHQFQNLSSPVPMSYLDDNFDALNVGLFDSEAVNLLWFVTTEAERAAIKAGTSSTDHTALLTSAITLGAGRAVYLPAGRWNFSALTLTQVGLTLFGDGWNTIVRQSSPTSHLFTAQAANITIRDLQLQGAATSAANTTFAIFTATATPATGLRVQSVKFSGSSSAVGFNNAIKFDDSCDDGLVEGCEFERLWGTASGYGYGVLAGAASNVRVLSNKFTGAASRGRHAVYFSAGSSRCIAAWNYVTAFNYEGMTMNSQGAQSANSGNVFAYNTVTGCCVAVPGTTTGALSIFGHSVNCKLVGNLATGNKANGIHLDGTGVNDLADTIINGNTASDNDYFGIRIVAGVRGVLSSNELSENSRSSAGSYSNIALKSDPATTATNGWTVTGNLSRGTTYARSAFYLDSTAPTPSNLKVFGNQFEVCNLTDIELNGVTCAIDGRVRFSQASVSYGPIANNAALSTGYTVAGANSGDVVTVAHSSNSDGCAIYGYVSATNTVTIVVVNNSGASKTIASGTLYIDVWKRSP